MTAVSLYVIGTELTRGIIEDKHIPLLTKQLTALGFFVKRAVIVPDDGTIGTSLSLGAKDSDVILVTGGLGPTSDDMTRQYIASLANVPLEKNQGAWETLYKRVGERIYGANEIQAMIPKGFEVIPNPNGTAPGFKGTFQRDGKTIFIAAMPGPPQEMQPMLFNYMLPALSELIGAKMPDRDEYSVFLIAEAKLEELCLQVRNETGLKDIDWGTRFQATKISLYISGMDSACRKQFVSRLKEKTGKELIADGNTEAVEMLTSALSEKGYTISTVESATSGYLGKMLTDKAGSSAWYWGGMQTYNVCAKNEMLGVPKYLTDKYGTVSPECAFSMAQNINRISKTDFSISISGVAGPDSDEMNNSVGTVCFGFCGKDRIQTAKLVLSSHNREANRRRFCVASMLLCYFFICGKNIEEIVKDWHFI